MADRKKVSITRIAQEAGVSPSTVSRVLTGNAWVNPEKRTRIEAVIDKYDYRPNYANGAQAVIAKKTLGMILPDITHPYWSAVFVGAEKEALEHGYGILLGNTMNDSGMPGHATETMLLDLMVDRRVSGILLLGGSIDDHVKSGKSIEHLREIDARVPVLTSGIENPPWGGSTLISDNTGAIEKAAHYLTSLKHRRIGFLGGDPNVDPSDSRRNALIHVLEEADLPYREEWFVYSGFSLEDGVTAMENLLQNREIPSAIMCVNDLVAIGAMYTAQRHGLVIPDDISIIGCDNIELTRYLTPTLTTIDLKAGLIGRTAAKLLLDRIEDHDKEEHLAVEAELVIRESCRRAALP